MKTPNLLRVLLMHVVFLCCCCSMGLAQIYQNTYAFAQDNHDHYSVGESFVLGQTIQAGTQFTGTGHRAHFQHVDDAGAVIWETSKTNTNNDNNRAFHVDQDPFNTLGSFGGQTYMYAGIFERPAGNTGVLGFIDDSGANGTMVELVTPGWQHTNVLHVVAANTPDPGYLVTGFVSQGFGNTDSKQGYAVLIDAATLSVTWTHLFDSTPLYTPDWDMLNNGIEIPGQGFFLSGSSNGHVSQDAFAVKIDYLGNTIWDESYHYDTTPNAEYNIATSAVYDDVTDRIYQLVNLSETHCFAISAYDGSDPFTNRLPESMTFINGNYSNTSGYSLHLAPGSQSLTVAGLVRDAWANGTDAEGNPISIAGSFPFMLNVNLAGSLINWQHIYPVPSSGYSTSTDIFDSFSAGQQPRILYPEMAHPKNSGDGYVLNAYRFDLLSDPHDLEALETDLLGANPCEQAPLGISFYNDSWISENVVTNNVATGARVLSPLLDVLSNQDVTTCGQVSNCQFTIDWEFLHDLNICEKVDFFDLTVAAAGSNLCYSWDFGDGNFSNLQNPTHLFPGTGTYNVCLTVECCDDPTGASKQILCKTIDIDCGDPCIPDPAFSILDLGDCCYEFMDLTPSGIPGANCQEWEILDAAGNHIVTGVFGSSFVHCFTADGTYTICYVDCCVNPDGTITYVSVCQDLVVDCSCEPYGGQIFTAIHSQDCENMNIIISLDPGSEDYCVDFIFMGVHYVAIYDATVGYHTVTIPTPCPGDYAGEILVYCCDDPSIVVSQAMDFVVDHSCCCEVDPAFNVDQIDDCCWAFADLTPDTDENCNEWTIYDDLGNVVANHVGDFWTHCFDANGVYTVCNVDCCIHADGTVEYFDFCDQIVVTNCGCELPNADELTLVLVNNDVNCKQIGACVNNLDGTGLGAEYCIDWTWGDGSGQTNSAAFCPFHDYLCNGTYEVCAKIYCCEDPSQVIELCGSVTIDCPCDVPTDVNFDILVNDDCTATPFLVLPDVPCPNEICTDWILPVGVSINAVTGNFEFAADGTYTICLNVFCCDNPAIGYVICHDVVIDCPCVLPNADELTLVLVNNDINCKQIGACVNNIDGTGLGSDLCIDWTWGDGTSQSNSADFCPFHAYDCNGDYVVCARIYCCEDPDHFIDLCGSVVIDCPCTPPTDVNFDLVMNDDCTASVILTPFLDPCGEYCFDWFLPAGVAFDAVTGNLVFPGNGTYTLCLWVYCCNDPNIGYEVCHTVDIDCHCEVDPTFAVDQIDDCCFAFADLTPDTDENCNEWTIYDAFGTLVASFNGDFWTYCFDANGVYTVCNTDCCIHPDGTMEMVDYCDQIVVTNCGCDMPNADELTLVLVNNDVNCKQIGACVNNLDGTGLGAEYCIDWSWGDGSGQSNSADFCPFHDYLCNGLYEVCAKIYCCDDPSDVIEICGTVQIDCPCALPTGVNFDVLLNDDCTATPILVFPDVPCPEEICTEWILPAGVSLNPVTGNFDFPGDGNYTLCLNVFCCDYPSVGYVICHDITIDCACVLPTDADLELNLVGSDTNCKRLGACVNFGPGIDVSELCIDWTWGDGSSQSEIAGFCPLHDYACSGTYEVCANIYCCEDPSNVVTICGVYTIDCPCDLPSVDFVVNVNDDCSADADILFTADTPCPDEVCYAWTVIEPGVGVVAIGTGAHFDFPGDGVYQICLTVFCCEDESIAYSLCQLVEVDCACELPEGLDIDIVHDATDTHCRDVGVCVVPVGGTGDIYCVDYIWGDGSVTSGTLDFCPEHTYDCNGVYTLCVEVYCCEDPTNRLSICQEVVIDCPCVLPQVDFGVLVNDDCTATPIITLPVDPCDEVCYNFFSTSPGVVYNAVTGQYEFPGSGTYDVCVDVFCCNGTGLGYSLCETVTVECDDCPKPCEIYPSWTYSMDPITLSEGCCVQFHNTSQAGPHTTIVGYLWHFGDPNGSTSENPYHCYNSPGTYTVTLTVYGESPDGPCSQTFSFQITCDCEDTCPEDVDQDGIVGVSDLLAVLGKFLQECP